MEYIILGLLFFKDMTIYEMNSNFKESLSLIYSASYGSLQNATKKLLKTDLINFSQTIDNGRNKKIYRISDLGKAAFLSWMMQNEISPGKLEVTMLSKIYFLGLIESIEDKMSIIHGLLKTATIVTDEMKSFRGSLSALQLSDDQLSIAKYQFKTLDYGIMAHDSGLSWLKDFYSELESELETSK